MEEQKEISNIILSNADNLASALTIRSALDDVKKNLLKKFHSDLISCIDNENGEHVKWQIDDKYKTYSGFFLYSDKLDYYNLCFGLEFENRDLNGCCWGLARSKEDIFLTPIDHDNAQKILANPNSSSNKWWGWYSYDFSLLNLPSDSINWSASPAPWRAIYDGSLANKISELWKSAIKNAAAMSDKSIIL